VLDGWPLVGALAADRGIDRWRHAADESVSRVVATSGDAADAARVFADRVHTMIARRSDR
jgi:hypothetical protein